VDLDRGTVILNPGDSKNEERRTGYLDEELKNHPAAKPESTREGSKVLPLIFLNEEGT
jgi:hypothetical protein